MSIGIWEVFHWATLLIYCVVLSKAVWLLKDVSKCPHPKGLKRVLYAYLVSLATMSGFYFGVQFDLLHYEYTWSVYDIANGFVQLFFILTIEVWLKWKTSDGRGRAIKRRRKSDI